MDIFGENGKASYPASTASNGNIIVYHPSCRRILTELSHTLNKYFSAIELRSFREYWPPNKQEDLQELSSVRKGLYSRILKNHSLIASTANPDPTWRISSPRIRIHPETLQSATLSALDHIDKPRSILTGFVLCYCLAERLFDKEDIVCYNPIVGGWIAAAEDEGYRDRELKGIFCWRNFPREVQLELQYAFLLKVLIDAAWWSIDDRDKSVESNRFVSIPIEDLVYFPNETLELLNEIGEQIFCQHWEPEHPWIGPHQVAKCPCSKFQSANARSYLLLPTRKLRTFLENLARSSGRYQSTDSVLSHILRGRPSQRVMAAMEEARLRLRVRLARRSKVPPTSEDFISQSLKRIRPAEVDCVDRSTSREDNFFTHVPSNDRKWARRSGKPPTLHEKPTNEPITYAPSREEELKRQNDIESGPSRPSSARKLIVSSEDEDLSSSLGSEFGQHEGSSVLSERKISQEVADEYSDSSGASDEVSPVYMDSPLNPTESYIDQTEKGDVLDEPSLTFQNVAITSSNNASCANTVNWDDQNIHNNGNTFTNEDGEESDASDIIDID